MHYGPRLSSVKAAFRSPGLWLFLGGLEMLLLVHLAEFTFADYSVSRDVISRLGTGEALPKAIFTVALVLFGAMALTASALLRRRQAGSNLWLLLALAGIGAIGVALFDMDNFSVVHAAFAVMAFFFGNLAAIFSFRLVRPPLSWLFVLLGLIGLSALVLFGTETYFGLGRGGMERMIFYPSMFWALGFGAYLLAGEGPSEEVRR